MPFNKYPINLPKYALWALTNFVILGVAGTVLRYKQAFSLPAVNYKFLLHSHSHFAFSGWMFLSIALLFVYRYKNQNPQQANGMNLLFGSTLVISFGMLVTFLFTGYKTASIVLSTLFIFVGYWFVIELINAKFFKTFKHSFVDILLKGSLLFLVLSSLGPFFLAFFKASGFKRFDFQQSAIYFYLHFQLNGFMQLALIGLCFKCYVNPDKSCAKVTGFWSAVLVWSTIPLYAMFILWLTPPFWVNVIAFLAAILHLLAWLVLVFRLKADFKSPTFLVRMAFLAITLQFFFQTLVAFPVIGNWTFSSRNLIIGYIHLLTLGSLSPLIIDLFAKAGFLKNIKTLNYVFATVTVFYLMLLFGATFLAVFQIYIPNLGLLLLINNIILPVVALAYLINAIKLMLARANLSKNEIIYK